MVKVAKFCLLLGLILGLNKNAFAAPNASNNRGVTLSPTYQNLDLATGLITAHTQIVLTNHSGQNLALDVRVQDFNSVNSNGSISFVNDQSSNRYGLKKWLQFPSGTLYQIADGQTLSIPVDVTNADDMAAGGHYGAVIVNAGVPSVPGGAKVTFRQELVSLFLVKKTGGIKYGLQALRFTTDEKNNVPSSAMLELKSTGNVHVVPRGFVSVTDPSGKQVAKGILNEQSALVFPGVTRSFEVLMAPTAEAKLPGEYKVTAYYRYEGASSYQSVTRYFHRWRYSPLLVVGLLITGVVVVVLARQIHWRRG